MKNRFKYKTRPTRGELGGLSPSEFKTKLKRNGFKVPRKFYANGSIAYRDNRAYRFRWWSDNFVVDVSCHMSEFDRWANSVEEVKYYVDWAWDLDNR